MSNKFRIIVEGVPSALKGYSMYTESLNQLVDQRRALVADDWEGLEALANHGLGMANGFYCEMRQKLGLFNAVTTEITEDFLEGLKEHAKDGQSRQEFFDKIKEELLKLNPEIDKKYLDGLDAFSKGKLQGNPLLSILNKKPSEDVGEMEQSAVNATVALASRSLMSITFSNFQQHFLATADHQFTGPYESENFLILLQEEVNTFKEVLERKMKKLHHHLCVKTFPSLHAENLCSFIEENLPRFARIQATIRRYANYMRNEGKGAMSEKIGGLAAMAGDLSRQALAAQAAGYYLSLQMKLEQPDAKAKKIIEESDELAFEIPLPNGKNVEISKVNKLKENDYVEVEGFVVGIETGKSKDKDLITQVTLSDPSSDATVVASGIYAHLIHTGLSEGTYCRLNGKWQSASGLNKGKPAIQIEELAVNKLSKHSWKSAFLDLSDQFYNRWPDGLNMSFGLSPHFSGKKEGESKILGAGEIIYKSFIK